MPPDRTLIVMDRTTGMLNGPGAHPFVVMFGWCGTQVYNTIIFEGPGGAFTLEKINEQRPPKHQRFGNLQRHFSV